MKLKLKQLKFKSFLICLLLLVVLVGLLIPSRTWMQQKVAHSSARLNSPMSPMILVPGSSASKDRFDTLVNLINEANIDHSLIKVTVKKNDAITVSGQLKPKDNNPFIVISFENNQDGYANIKKQGRWMSLAMTYLQKRYNFNNFRGIGHSNGGLIFTYYLENYYDSDVVSLSRLMTIGTPYNFEESSINNKTEMLSDFIKKRDKLPKDMVLYSIAGTENYTDDGIVPEASVTAGKYIYQNRIKEYTEITVTGQDSAHSDLPQNKQIVNLITQYIVNDPFAPKQKTLKKKNGNNQTINPEEPQIAPTE